jgi:hypothetical protein
MAEQASSPLGPEMLLKMFTHLNRVDHTRLAKPLSEERYNGDIWKGVDHSQSETVPKSTPILDL